MKKASLILFLLAAVLVTNAQNYNQAIGLRFANGGGFTYKKTLNASAAFEGIAGFRYNHNEHYNNTLVVTGLYEWQNEIREIPNLSWFIGLGAHVGVGDGVWLGGDGIIGLEYKIKPAPFAVSLDWKPAFNIVGGGFYGDEVALSIRYTF